MPAHYSFYQIENNRFEFFTKHQLHYSVYFSPAKDEYFIEYSFIPDNIYTFGFELINEPTSKKIFDEDVQLTIIEILKKFFTNQQNAIIYFCDISNRQQRHRKITFNKWFNKYNTDLIFEKIDREFIVDDLNHFYVSLVFHNHNPDKDKYQLAFIKIADELNNK